MNELHLFAGAGGGILGGILLGHTCVCAVEIEPYCRKVLLQRQRDGILPRFPIWGDVRTFDGKPWRGKVDVVCGGFPCQDISYAGKGSGLEGSKSGLWKEFARVVCEVRPGIVFVENSPALVIRGLGSILRDLAKMGYNAKWGVYGGKETPKCPILRERIWILAAANGSRWDLCWRSCKNERQNILESKGLVSHQNGWNGWNFSAEEKCKILGMADGMAGQLDRIHAAGNGQVPQLAKFAWETLINSTPTEPTTK